MGIFLLNPFLVQPPVFSPRVFFDSAYTATRTTTTQTANTSRVSVSTTETSGKNYAAFWQITHDNSQATNDSRVNLEETSIRNSQTLEPQDTTDRFSGGGLFAYAGGTNKTFSVTSSSESATHGYAGYQVGALELDATEDWDFSAVVSSQTTTTPTTLATVNMSSSGTYFLIAYGEILALNNTNLYLEGGTGTDINTGQFGNSRPIYQQDTSNYSPWFQVIKAVVTGTGSATVKYSSQTAGQTATVKNIGLVALRADKFANSWYANTRTEQTTTSATYASVLSLSAAITSTANTHLILGGGLLRTASTSVSGYNKLINTTDTVDYNVEQIREGNATTEYIPSVICRFYNFGSTGTKSIQWQTRAETAGTTVGLSEMNILVLDLGA